MKQILFPVVVHAQDPGFNPWNYQNIAKHSLSLKKINHCLKIETNYKK
jgi:hypothetical protein